MKPRAVHYYIQGFAIELYENRRCPADIFFQHVGKSFVISGADVYDPKNHRYLGFVQSFNIGLGLQSAILDYIKTHRSRWMLMNDTSLFRHRLD